MWAAQFCKFRQPNTLITSGGLGAMGFEVPAAIGAKVGRPDKTVWSIAGDGGFQMTMCDLAVAAEHRVDVKFAILNNGTLGMVHQWQDLFYEKDYFATVYSGNPDFVKIADSYGIRGIRVDGKGRRGQRDPGSDGDPGPGGNRLPSEGGRERLPHDSRGGVGGRHAGGAFFRRTLRRRTLGDFS